MGWWGTAQGESDSYGRVQRMMRLPVIAAVAASFLIGLALAANGADARHLPASKPPTPATGASAAAKPGTGWKCSGPPNMRIAGDHYTPAPGRIICHIQRCRRSNLCTLRDPRWIIAQVFRGRLGRQAIRVAWCEGRFNTAAGGRGYYRGTFQVSAQWRRDAPGYGPGLWAQARHARRVNGRTGGHWRPWQCRPG